MDRHINTVAIDFQNDFYWLRGSATRNRQVKSTAFHVNGCLQRKVILTVVSMTGSMGMKKSKLTVNHPNTEKR